MTPVLSEPAVAALLAAYLIGSLPFGYLVPWLLRGADIRRLGSGNPGATNVYRTIGPAAGLAVGALDGFKGWLGVVAAEPAAAGAGEWLPVAAALAVVAGHTWPAWLGFRGGKGVITSAGAFLRLAWLPVCGAAALFAAVAWRTGMVGAGSVAAAVALPLLTFLVPGPWSTPAVRIATLLVGALVVIRHRTNIARMLAGTEYRFGGRRRGRTR